MLTGSLSTNVSQPVVALFGFSRLRDRLARRFVLGSDRRTGLLGHDHQRFVDRLGVALIPFPRDHQRCLAAR